MIADTSRAPAKCTTAASQRAERARPGEAAPVGDQGDDDELQTDERPAGRPTMT